MPRRCSAIGHFQGTPEEIKRTNLEFLAVLWHLRETESAGDVYIFLREILSFACSELSFIDRLDFYFIFFCEEITSKIKLNRFLRDRDVPFQQLLDFSGEKVSLEELPTLIRANPTKWLRIYADLINIRDLRGAPEAFEFMPKQDIPDDQQIRTWFNVLGTMAFMDPSLPLISFITEMCSPEHFLKNEWSEEEKKDDNYQFHRMIYLFHEYWKKIRKLPLRVVDIPSPELITTNYAIGPKIVPKKVEVISSYLICVAVFEYWCDLNVLEWIVSGYF